MEITKEDNLYSITAGEKAAFIDVEEVHKEENEVTPDEDNSIEFYQEREQEALSQQ